MSQACYVGVVLRGQSLFGRSTAGVAGRRRADDGVKDGANCLVRIADSGVPAEGCVGGIVRGLEAVGGREEDDSQASVEKRRLWHHGVRLSHRNRRD